MTPVLISTLVKIEEPGWQQEKCDICGEFVSEHKENIERVRQMKGYVICVVCAMVLKVDAPKLKVEAQLWHGHLRKTEPHKTWEPIIDWLNRK